VGSNSFLITKSNPQNCFLNTEKKFKILKKYQNILKFTKLSKKLTLFSTPPVGFFSLWDVVDNREINVEE